VLVLLLLAAGLLRGFTSGGSGSVPGTTAEATPSVIAAVEPSITAAITMTAPPAPAPTNTAAPSPTTPATASPTPLRATPTVAAAVTPEEGPPLPYILRLEPMTAAARTAFLARARAANCADCFNVDLIGPEPYVELRVKIDDDDPPVLRTFEVPSLAFVAPADEPRTLQAFDLQDNPVSPPISVDVAPDRYYVLRIVTP
jgi:hypothetical protein